ncbi:hypothetical protein B0T17DRAFT_634209 [Bombardia bombarda]|uniref:Uncharacterized protein n=1 Tax=Bombardia bombarda TaxID=252184 RepID=A0AA40C9R5_9PEZI|nr:hypothetical protein B0T17DRAFT_634209 [Bombardia bombarda]
MASARSGASDSRVQQYRRVLAIRPYYRDRFRCLSLDLNLTISVAHDLDMATTWSFSSPAWSESRKIRDQPSRPADCGIDDNGSEPDMGFGPIKVTSRLVINQPDLELASQGAWIFGIPVATTRTTPHRLRAKKHMEVEAEVMEHAQAQDGTRAAEILGVVRCVTWRLVAVARIALGSRSLAADTERAVVCRRDRLTTVIGFLDHIISLVAFVRHKEIGIGTAGLAVI